MALDDGARTERERTPSQAALWAVGGKLGSRLIDFAALLTLAQLLTPADFGLVALASVVVLVIETITDVPLTQPILRALEPTPDHYHTAFTLGLIRAATVGLVVAALAPTATGYYDEPRLAPLLLALTLAPIFRSLMSPRLAAFARSFDMRPSFAVNILGRLGAFVALGSVALLTRSYWAIAIGSIAGPATMAFVSYIAAPYRPRLSLARWGEFADVIGWVSLSQVLSAAANQADRLLLGRSLDGDKFGRYTLGSDLSGIPMQGVLFPLFPPLIVTLARAAASRSELQLAWMKWLNASLLTIGAIFVGLATMSQPILHVMAGPEWAGAGRYLALMSMAMIPTAMGHMITPLAVAAHKSHLASLNAGAGTAVRVPLTIVGVSLLGAEGAILAAFLAGCATAILMARGAREITGLTQREQALGLWRTGLGLACFAVVAMAMRPAFDHMLATGAGRLQIGLLLVATAALATTILTATVAALWMVAGKPNGIETEAARRIEAAAGRFSGTWR